VSGNKGLAQNNKHDIGLHSRHPFLQVLEDRQTRSNTLTELPFSQRKSWGSMKEHKQILIETKNFYAGNNLNFSLT
jgi:hypothetical protein